MPLTADELETLDLLSKAWGKFLELPEQHPVHRQEFMFSIHQLQRLIMSRSAARELGLVEMKMDGKRSDVLTT